MKNLIGAKLGQYEILEKVGQGGMAQVYKAHQPSLNRFVAIKILPPSLAEEAGFTERFQREAQAIARLHHPNILQVYDYGVQDNYNYLVMRYVENSVTLGDLIRKKIPTSKLIDYILQVADALNYAHEQGIIHRDVKPGNILIDGKWALLSDFGLVKTKEATSQLTGTGVGMGTPAYMSPEQASGTKAVDHRTDIYALGIILHQILTGTIPHDAPTPLAILIKRSTQPVPLLRQIKPDIQESLEHVVLRSVAMDPDTRYGTATDFAEALEKAEADPNYREETISTLYSINEATVAHTGPLPLPSTQSGLTSSGKRTRFWLGTAITGVVATIATLIFFLVTVLGSDDSQANQSIAQIETPSPTSPAATITHTPISPTDTPVSTPPPPGVPSITAKADLEVRTGPGDEYELMGYLPQGVKAEISGRDKSSKWWQVKTSLAASGVGWTKAEATLVETTETSNVPIALAPPTPTGTSTSMPATPTPTLTATTPADIPTATATSTTTPTRVIAAITPKAPAVASATPAPTGQFVLLKPLSLDQPSFGPTEFEWQWGGELAPDQGFEVRVWLEGEAPSGVHNALEDNQKGNIVALGNNTYRLTVNIREAFGVKGRSGEYLWTVVLIQVSPEYKDLGVQAPPARLRFEAGGGGSDKDGGGGGGDGGSSL